jgi:protein-arginine kinase activator protein McsA
MMNELNDMVGDFHEPLFIKGETKNESGTDSKGDWSKETFTSKDGTYQVTSFVRTYGGEKTSDKQPTKIESLKSELKTAVEKEDFQLAITLRDKIKELEKNEDKVLELQNKLKQLVEKQEFEDAIKVRDELKKYE